MAVVTFVHRLDVARQRGLLRKRILAQLAFPMLFEVDGGDVILEVLVVLEESVAMLGDLCGETHRLLCKNTNFPFY